jgi:drebrin-like protein
MADKVSFVDDSVQQALTEFRGTDRNDKGERFIVIGYEGKNKLKVIATGEGGLEEAKEYLPADECRYILVRKVHMVEISTTTKFGYIDWTPQGIRPMRRALLSTHKSQVEDMLKPHHVTLQADCMEELQDSVILDKIGMSSGTKSFVSSGPVADHKKVVYRGLATADTKVNKKRNDLVPTSSFELAFDDEDEIKAAIQSVRDDSNPNTWAMVGYESMKMLTLLGTGTGDVAEMIGNLDEERATYAFFRQEAQYDESVTVKFGFVRMVTMKIPTVKRAKLSTHRGFITKVFEPFHLEFDISASSDISPQIVTEKIEATMFTKTTSAATLSARLAQQNAAADKKSSSSHAVPTATAAQIGFEDEEEFKNAIAAVRSDENETNWMVASYVRKHTLDVTSTGSGDVSEFLSKFEEKTPAFGLTRVVDQIDNSRTIKFVYVRWQPESTPAMKKGEISVMRSQIDQLFRPCHVDFNISHVDDISPAVIEAAVGSASGSRSNVVNKE